MTGPAPALDAERFARIEEHCKVQFDESLRQSLNECIAYWGGELAKPYTYRGPRLPRHGGEQKAGKKQREGSRKRRQAFLMELALHFEIAGGKPGVNGWNREMGEATGFAIFLLEIYDILPEAARPRTKRDRLPNAETFVRDSELLARAVAENRAEVLALGFRDDPRLHTPGGSIARAGYMLQTMTAWRR